MLSQSSFEVIKEYLADLEYYEGKMQELETVREELNKLPVSNLKLENLQFDISNFGHKLYSQDHMNNIPLIRMVGALYDYYEGKARECKNSIITYLQS